MPTLQQELMRAAAGPIVAGSDCRRRSPPADTEPGDSLSAPRCVPGGAESELDICYHLGLYQRFFFSKQFHFARKQTLDTMTLCGHFVPVRRNRDHLGRQRQDKEEGSKGGRYYYIVSFLFLFFLLIIRVYTHIILYH